MKEPLISISTWQDAVEYLLAGATAVQIGTAWFVYPDVFIKMKKGLVTYLARDQLAVRDLTGKAHRMATK